MAGINGTITFSDSQYRPCVVNEKKALFHRWEQRSEIVPPSPMVGGHNGGVIMGLVGIVEFEDGTIGRREPGSIRFTDNKFKEYCFENQGNTQDDT